MLKCISEEFHICCISELPTRLIRICSDLSCSSPLNLGTQEYIIRSLLYIYYFFFVTIFLYGWSVYNVVVLCSVAARY